ncbi:MAG: type II secretion system protein [Synergistaceae bacterium]|nr:type II secretion system protein [Synergistaceae bacterium]
MGNRNRKRGFTLIEIVTAMLVMAVIAGAAMMSITSAKQTAKREAERVQAYIYRQMQRADRMHKDFTIQVFSDHLQVNIDSEPFKPSEGCAFANYTTQDKSYSHTKKGFTGGSIKVKGADNNTWYVVLANPNTNEGRVRISDKEP